MPHTPPDATAAPQPSALEIILRLQSQHRAGATWFYWIAALAMIHAVGALMGARWNVVVGLGLMQVINGIAQIVGQQTAGHATLLVKGIALAFDLGIAGAFVAFGFLAGLRRIPAYVTGLVVYAFDGLLFLLARDILSVGFHAVVLVCIYRGLQASLKLTALEHAFQAGPAPVPAP